MTRYMLAILSLPLAFVVGCGINDNGNDGNTECIVDCDDTNDPTEFAATLRSVAPYGWVGDHYVWSDDDHSVDPACEDVNECDSEVADYGNYRLSISGDTFDCVPQVVLVGEPDEGTTVDVTSPWTGEGICFLTPDGEYSGMHVWTTIDDENGSDQGWIGIESVAAVITGDTFYHKDSEYLLEGTVSQDLAEVQYHLVIYNEDGSVFNEWNQTITLED